MSTKIEDIISLAKKHQAEILVVSKNRTNDAIVNLYNMGFRNMGENRVQSLMDKKDDLPQDIQWHIIGTLQRNKVKYIAPFIQLIHSVDSFKLLKEINKEAKKNDRVIDFLFQFKVADEESKQGLSPKNAMGVLKEFEESNLKNVRLRGIMGMGTFTEDENQVRQEFQVLKSIFDRLKTKLDTEFNILSMGMSGDYEIALEEGSTMLRLGSVLFESI